MIVATLFFLFFLLINLFVINKILKGEINYFLYYSLLFFPFYTIIQVIIFDYFQNEILVNLIKISKDFIFFISISVILINKKNIINFLKNGLSNLDKYFSLFFFLILFYVIIPLGEESFITKFYYARTLFFIPFAYLIGRNIDLAKFNSKTILRLIISIGLIASFVGIFEFIFKINFHTIFNYGVFNYEINNVLPSGNFGLSWTFERQGVIPRYASIFADPLEFANSLILPITTIIFLISYNTFSLKVFYQSLIIISILIFSSYVAFSRIIFISLFFLFFSVLIFFKKYKALLYLIIAVILFSLLIYFYSDQDFKYFIIDTLTFRNSSSLGHITEWISGLISIYENPLGIGLSMSGNANSVDQAIAVGGENQFIIIGVQMGIFAMLLYILLLYKSLKCCFKLINKTPYYLKYIPFVAGFTKLSLIFSLLTSNAELYLYVSISTWCLIGLTENIKLNFDSSYEM